MECLICPIQSLVDWLQDIGATGLAGALWDVSIFLAVASIEGFRLHPGVPLWLWYSNEVVCRLWSPIVLCVSSLNCGGVGGCASRGSGWVWNQAGGGSPWLDTSL